MTGLPAGMRVAFHPNSYVLSPAAGGLAHSFATVVRRADAAGVSAIALMDHFLPPGPFPREDPVLEGYTALGFVAAHTTTADVMLLVSGVTHRHPVLLAKAVTTLDVLSGGRARLGIGAGWFEPENTAYGLPFPPAPERFEMLDETLGIVRRLWAPGTEPVHGRLFTVESTVFSPQPVRRPHPPILVGGNGRQRTLRLVARHADACNLLAGPDQGGPEAVAAALAVLRGHCAAEGSDFDRITKTILYTAPVGTDTSGAERFADQMRAYAALGIQEVFVMPVGHADPLGFVDRLGSAVIPAVAAATGDLLTQADDTA